MTYGPIFTPDASSFYVILLEPATEPPDPTETLLSVPGIGLVSDVVVENRTTAPGALEFLSDGNPQITNILPFLVAGAPSVFVAGAETGGLQDLTSPLGFPVQVQSDMVPEPSTLLLLASGLTGIAARSRRLRS